MLQEVRFLKLVQGVVQHADGKVIQYNPDCSSFRKGCVTQGT